MTATASPQRRGRGCWLYGCGALLFLTLFGLILVYFGARYFIRSVDTLVQNYTTTNAVPIATVELPGAEWTNLQQRVEVFGRALEGQGGPAELVLSERELNGLIAKEPKFKDLRGRLQVSISSNTLGGQISIPLDDLGIDKLKGRFLNGAATFLVSLQNGQLDVRINEMTVNKEPLPGVVLNELRKENLAKDAQKDPETARSISKFDSIQIQDGHLILKSRGASTNAPPPDARRVLPVPQRHAFRPAMDAEAFAA